MNIPKNFGERWLFSDTLKAAGYVMEFVDFKIDKSKDGKIEMPVFILLGSTEEHTGDFRVSTWNITNLNALLLQYGDDPVKWKNIKFRLTPNGKGILMTPAQ